MSDSEDFYDEDACFDDDLDGDTFGGDDAFLDGTSIEVDSEEESSELLEDEEESSEIEDRQVQIMQDRSSAYVDEYIVVPPEKRMTSHILSKYEHTNLVSIRAEQISKHNNCQVLVEDLIDPIEMAKRELSMRRCPLLIKRVVGIKTHSDNKRYTHVEYWNPNEMQHSSL